MAWTAPVTAVASTDYTFTQYNKDAANIAWVVRPLVVLGAQDFTNTTLESDMLGDATVGDCIIPANSMGAAGCLRVTYSGHFINSAVSHLAAKFRMYWGGSIVWQDNMEPIDNHPVAHPFRLRFYVCNCGATNSQFIAGVFILGTATAPTTGSGDLGTVVTTANGPYVVPFGSSGKTAVDTTVDQTLKFTAAMQGYPDIHFFRGGATVELIGQG